MKPVKPNQIATSDVAGVSGPAPAESAIGAWTVEVSPKYRCIKCGDAMLELVHYMDAHARVQDTETPLLCPNCYNPNDLTTATKTIAKLVKDKEEALDVLRKLLDHLLTYTEVTQ